MATLRVIDAASHQGNMNQSAMDFDALIVKATEGVDYINPYCDSEFQEAYRLGKCLGVYHFARNTKNSAEAEANYFIKNTKGYIGKAIPVLDWEDSNTSDVSWALKWLQIVEETYGYKPMIYMSESVVNRYDWSRVANGNYGLWVAKYADYIPDYNFNMASAGPGPSVKWWENIALWQWTSVGRLNGHSGNLDCSVFYGDAATWGKYISNSVDHSGEWVWDDNKQDWWFKYSDGSYPKACWKQIGGTWYYFDSEGYAVRNNWVKDSGYWYYLNDNCSMATGWKWVDNAWYYLNPVPGKYPHGAMLDGWQWIGNDWFYLNPVSNERGQHGAMLEDMFDDGDYTYYCQTEKEGEHQVGSMVKGWKWIKDAWYYFNENLDCQPVGSMLKNHWVEQNGKKYYLTDTGRMAKDTTLNISGKKYTFNNSGEVV